MQQQHQVVTAEKTALASLAHSRVRISVVSRFQGVGMSVDPIWPSQVCSLPGPTVGLHGLVSRCLAQCSEFSLRVGFASLLGPGVHLQDDPHRFSELAQMLIHSTQGKDGSPTGEGQVSYDDVSVFVIPLYSQGQGSSGH